MKEDDKTAVSSGVWELTHLVCTLDAPPHTYKVRITPPRPRASPFVRLIRKPDMVSLSQLQGKNFFISFHFIFSPWSLYILHGHYRDFAIDRQMKALLLGNKKISEKLLSDLVFSYDVFKIFHWPFAATWLNPTNDYAWNSNLYLFSILLSPLFHLNTWNELFALSVAVRIKLYSLSYAQNAVSALSSHDLMVRETTRRKTVQFKEAEWNRS